MLRFQGAPRMWEPMSFADGVTLRLGKTHLALSDVRAVERTDHAERDFQGVLVMGMVFTMSSACFAIGVWHYGWRQRFLLAAAIFFVLGVISLYEALTSTTFRYVRLRIATTSGETVFTTAALADAAALEQVLALRRA